jgi:hypothetical protein
MAKNLWIWLMFDTWSLGLETSAVIASRTMKLVAGGEAAEKEAGRMVGEKIEAASACKRWLSRAAWERHRKVRPENRSRITDAGCVPTGVGWLKNERALRRSRGGGPDALPG